MNDPILSLQAKLDQAKSTQDINNDILEIQQQLDHLKLLTEIDPQSISTLNKQLDNILEQNIKVTEIQIDESQVQQVGQQIGSTISSNISDSVRKASGDITSEIEKIGSQMKNTPSSPKGIFQTLENLKSIALTMSAFKNIQNIGKCRMSVRISKYCHCFEYALHA